MRIINSIQNKIKRIFANTIPNWVYFLSHTAMNQRALEWGDTAILVYFFKKRVDQGDERLMSFSTTRFGCYSNL